MNDAKTYYHRNLPHWHPPGAAIFLTCRLYGSLPEKVIQQFIETQKLLEREIEKATRSAKEIAELKLKKHKKLFAKIDAILDKAETGPRWLGQPEIARLVEDTLLQRYAELYRLRRDGESSSHPFAPQIDNSPRRESRGSFCASEYDYQEHKGLYRARG